MPVKAKRETSVSSTSLIKFISVSVETDGGQLPPPGHSATNQSDVISSASLQYVVHASLLSAQLAAS